ncbi:uncharacterized protein LOC122627753 [Vespula pensylvanica]|uniref:Uncharacterized protein n=1 Tax=Vespula pensylvanica TaxID=30213 RepID=A0A834P7C9_VESPE|nr:uncharacterized protein LOC122627753 [Vespula pensylvanica]KAF7431441.1 hypothetical protein H0235_004365 [Vespula pensylvanica]
MLIIKKVRKTVIAGQDDHCKRYQFKLRQIKSAIDMSPPKNRSHVIFNAKRAQLERERQAQILKDNFILLQKLTAIMYRKQIKDEYQRLRWQESKCVKIH